MSKEFIGIEFVRVVLFKYVCFDFINIYQPIYLFNYYLNFSTSALLVGRVLLGSMQIKGDFPGGQFIAKF